MLLVLSHALAFSTLFLNSLFDLKNEGNIPDLFSIVGVVGGILLHSMASLNAGFDLSVLLNFGILIQNPFIWLQALGDPLLWSLGVGIVFSIYGWGLYVLGMWGGADAFAMSVLGFAAPYSFSGPGIVHGIDLFLNIMIAGFGYTLLFAFYKALKKPEIWRATWKQLKQDEKRVSLEIVAAGLLGFVGEYTGGFNGMFYFVFFVSLIFLYRFLHNIQEDLLSHEVDVGQLEVGEVIAEDLNLGTHEVRRKNVLGSAIESFRSSIKRIDRPVLAGLEDRLLNLENRVGYPEIVGVTSEQIIELEERGIKKVEVKEGIKFVPVFPIALVLTDATGLGIMAFQLLVS